MDLGTAVAALDTLSKLGSVVNSVLATRGAHATKYISKRASSKETARKLTGGSCSKQCCKSDGGGK
jgi:hypothetical protein